MKAPEICPLCGLKLSYSSGSGMADNMVYCGKNKHPSLEFSASIDFAETAGYIQLFDKINKSCLRWTIEKYGDIPPNTITIGSDFSPYKNERIGWDYKSPLMDKFKEIIRKLEIQEIFS